jgi:hypothetical protein
VLLLVIDTYTVTLKPGGMKKAILMGMWLMMVLCSQAGASHLVHTTQQRIQAPSATGDTGAPHYTRKQLAHLKKEIRSRLKVLDGMYNKHLYTKEFIHGMVAKDPVLIGIRSFFLDLFGQFPDVHDTQMLLQRLYQLSHRKTH